MLEHATPHYNPTMPQTREQRQRRQDISTAAALMWAATQLVRSWLRLRIVMGICLGLLLIYAAHGLLHEFADVPDNIKYWQEHRAEELRRRNWPEDSFMARQLEKQLTGGAM